MEWVAEGEAGDVVRLWKSWEILPSEGEFVHFQIDQMIYSLLA